MATNLSQAKKMFHDYLDSKRPWATNKSMYDAMEEIVNHAAMHFANEPLPIHPEEVRDLQRVIGHLTEGMQKHPECIEDDDKGLCACHECVAESA